MKPTVQRVLHVTVKTDALARSTDRPSSARAEVCETLKGPQNVARCAQLTGGNARLLPFSLEFTDPLYFVWVFNWLSVS
jgi:hypothetical protein